MSPPFPTSAGLLARLGPELTERRRRRELALWRRKRREGPWALVSWVRVPVVIHLGLSILGLRRRAYREFLDIRAVENTVGIRNLPRAFDGFRLMQISDLHPDIDDTLVDRVIERIPQGGFDQCVVTGDYSDTIGKPWDHALELMRKLIPHLGADPLAILGNHDFLAVVEPLETAGLRVLLNENVRLRRGDDSIWLCGIDDPHSFGTHDLARASAGIPDGACRILLAHSPEVAAQAAALGYALQLSGHTHGGQICLPGGGIIVRKAPVRTALLAGAWEEDGMPGYTSRGTGGCTYPARLNCPPEITIHILRCA